VTVERQTSRRALIVDDDVALLRAHERALAKDGYVVETATDGLAAMQALRKMSFDVILSDIDMPGMNGIALLEGVRAHDLDVPVVIITGTPSLQTATKAIEHGALRYLVKPVDLQTLLKVANDAVRLHWIAKAKRESLDLAGGVDRLIGDHAGRMATFGRALESLYIAYQPIISWSRRSVYAYEGLLRSREPTLPHPGAVLDAAEKLGRLHDLGRTIRARAIDPLGRLAADTLVFLNLHPSDLLDDELFRADSPLANVAKRIVLEITERASLEGIDDVRARVAALRKLGFRIAVDDLGAGYAGLSSFALLEPDVVKLDMALIRGLDHETTKQRLVRTMITMCSELGITVTGEGIETTAERDELARAGCDLMQGYLFAKPGEAFPIPAF